ncbi:MAG TPA: hypothetical protein VH640_14960 [Bryobacteraceae bacterium]|jgi:hypothetical protein
MNARIIALAVFAFVCQNARSQSVAQSIETLTAKVANLEARPAQGPVSPASQGGSALVESTTQSDGGQLQVLDSQKRARVNLWASKNGGNILIANKDGAGVLEGMSYEDGGGGWRVVKSNKRVAALGVGGKDKTGGLWLYDENGTKVLALFGTTADGAAGYVEVNGSRVHDYSEVFDISDCDCLSPGSVVSQSSDGKGLQLSSKAYDPAAVGVISGAGSFQPGMRVGSRSDGSSDLPVAVAGQVYVWANSESGAISVGDLLVASGTPGVAMRGSDASRLTGTVIGKALQPYSGDGKSLIRMLVLNR